MKANVNHVNEMINWEQKYINCTTFVLFQYFEGVKIPFIGHV